MSHLNFKFSLKKKEKKGIKKVYIVEKSIYFHLYFLPLFSGAAGVLVGHPFDTVKVWKGLTVKHFYMQNLVASVIITCLNTSFKVMMFNSKNKPKHIS